MTNSQHRWRRLIAERLSPGPAPRSRASQGLVGPSWPGLQVQRQSSRVDVARGELPPPEVHTWAPSLSWPAGTWGLGRQRSCQLIQTQAFWHWHWGRRGCFPQPLPRACTVPASWQDLSSVPRGGTRCRQTSKAPGMTSSRTHWYKSGACLPGDCPHSAHHCLGREGRGWGGQDTRARSRAGPAELLWARLGCRQWGGAAAQGCRGLAGSVPEEMALGVAASGEERTGQVLGLAWVDSGCAAWGPGAPCGQGQVLCLGQQGRAFLLRALVSRLQSCRAGMLAAQVERAVAQGLLAGTQWPSEDSLCPFCLGCAPAPACRVPAHVPPGATVPSLSNVPGRGPRRPQVSSGCGPEPCSPRASCEGTEPLSAALASLVLS